MDHVILNHGQVTWTTPELAPPSPNYHTTPTREDVSALDRFNVHRCPTRRVFSGTGIELMTCLPWLDTLTTGLPQPLRQTKIFWSLIYAQNNIIDTDSDDKSGMNNAAPVLTSSKMWIMKSMDNCLDVHFNGEKINKRNDIKI
ncbi:uncharacterized protein TNCV_2372881 [Trichonephila clavipes]|nr:uncharacterized protein TNCV_2372881 [Trichonephila clavipes]